MCLRQVQCSSKCSWMLSHCCATVNWCEMERKYLSLKLVSSDNQKNRVGVSVFHCVVGELAVKLSEKFEKEGKTSAVDMDIVSVYVLILHIQQDIF